MRFHNIQLLRIVAAVAVVLVHLAYYAEQRFPVSVPLVQWLQVGTWGRFPVPLFFAVSGFVLTHAAQSVGTRSFLLARAIRLYPGFWMTSLVVLLGLHLTHTTAGLSWTTQIQHLGWTLRPHESGQVLYVLGIEWSLVYELMLSVWLALAAGVFGAKRGLSIAAAVWLLILGVRILWVPNYGMARPEEMLPTWQTVFLSAANVPFLLGVLVYPVRERGQLYRGSVLAGVCGYLLIVPGMMQSLEGQWCAYGIASAGVVWLAVQWSPVSPTNVFVKAGDWSYGLYLVHVPLIQLSLAVWVVLLGFDDPTIGILASGCAAIGVGLFWGKMESRLYSRLRAWTQTHNENLLWFLRRVEHGLCRLYRNGRRTGRAVRAVSLIGPLLVRRSPASLYRMSKTRNRM
ncbi:MAG: acyltransferase [Bacteroidales bacterium]|nr:acyltransferase [Bacteroidales bacterium]